jgi:hypothetical protein
LQSLRRIKVGALKFLFFFGKALATKTLWRILLVPGLWHEVILKKYLKMNFVDEWFRKGRLNVKGMSN